MFRQICIPWPLLLAVAVIAFLWLSFPLADVGLDIANRILLRPLDHVVRRIW